MRSSWPIVFAVLMVVAAAFWYDASNASASSGLVQPQTPIAHAHLQ
jgi:hypothetical protein